MSQTPAPAPGATALRLTGRDALPLLHRISTQALLDLTPGRARATLFCDFRGRVLHRAVAAVASDGAVWLFRPDAPGAELAAFLDRHVFRDEVTIEDRSAALDVALLEPATGVAFAEEAGVPCRVPAGEREALLVRPRDGASPGGASPAGERERIAAGRPAHGHEIVEAFNPYEVNLAAEVHLDKGCYTGQEALQRLVTYGSVRRELVRVSGAGPAPAVPAEVTRGGETVGVLTSAAAGEPPERWIGLAVVKKEALAGSEALVAAGSSLTVEPLPRARPAGLPTARR